MVSPRLRDPLDLFVVLRPNVRQRVVASLLLFQSADENPDQDVGPRIRTPSDARDQIFDIIPDASPLHTEQCAVNGFVGGLLQQLSFFGTECHTDDHRRFPKNTFAHEGEEFASDTSGRATAVRTAGTLDSRSLQCASRVPRRRWPYYLCRRRLPSTRPTACSPGRNAMRKGAGDDGWPGTRDGPLRSPLPPDVSLTTD